MSSPSPIILYDIPSKEPARCWSWNVWKTRLLLNYKGLDYVTEWTNYPEIKQKFEPQILNLCSFPNETEFTCPTIRLAGGEEYVMDSTKIAARLEADYPNPPIQLDTPYFARFKPPYIAAMTAIRSDYIYLVFTRVLADESLPYFKESRESDMGMSLEQYYQECSGGGWEKAKDGFAELTALLKENEGPFFMGHTVSYTDFMLIGPLLFLQTLGDDVFSKVIEASGDDGQAFKALLEASKPWWERDN
ncbi:hypothetical protein GQ53DRAFT_735884 [Thozetella sp. PMI_491]|nr:hypothetical protein GQ53DRAFT_735884 [Thozetella sp. PMI_491]